MTEIVRAVSRTLLAISLSDVLKQALLFCAAGLLVFVLLLTYGLDLSPGLF